MRGQLDAMEADRRPWISLDMQADGPLIHDALGWRLIINYTLKNIGKSPADDVDFLAFMIPWDKPRPNNDGSAKELDTPTSSIKSFTSDACKESDTFKAIDLGQIMFPDESWKKQWMVNDAHTIIGTGFSAHFIIIGCVTYKFLNDSVEHRTVKLFGVGKKDYKLIDITGESIPIDNLQFFPFPDHGSYAN